VPTALLIVDMQEGFAERDAGVHDLGERIARHVRDHRERYELVIASRFVNKLGSSYARLVGDDMQGGPEIELVSPISDAADVIVDSPTYSSVTADVVERLRAAGVDQVHVCGVDTDQCVAASVFAAFDAGFLPVALADPCSSCAGDTPHGAGLVTLRRALGEDRVIPAAQAVTASMRD